MKIKKVFFQRGNLRKQALLVAIVLSLYKDVIAAGDNDFSQKQEVSIPLMMLGREKLEEKKNFSSERVENTTRNMRSVFCNDLNELEDTTVQEEKIIWSAVETTGASKKTPSCQIRSILIRDKDMHISSADDAVRPFDPTEFLEEEEESYVPIKGDFSMTQVPSASKLEVSDTMKNLKEEIKKSQSKSVRFQLPEEEVLTASQEIMTPDLPLPSTLFQDASEPAPFCEKEKNSKKTEEKNTSKEYHKKLRRTLQLFISEIEIEVASIHDRAPDKARQEVRIYNTSYPKIRTHIESILATLQDNVAFQNEAVASTLADTAIAFLRVELHSINVEKMRPIKVLGEELKALPYHIIEDRELPVSKVALTQEIPTDDYEPAALIYTAYNIINDLKRFKAVLTTDNAQAGKALWEAETMKASGACAVASKQLKGNQQRVVALINATQALPSDIELLQELTEAKREAAKALEQYSSLSNEMLNKSVLTGPLEAKRSAIDNIIEIAKETLQVAAELKKMAAAREKVF